MVNTWFQINLCVLFVLCVHRYEKSDRSRDWTWLFSRSPTYQPLGWTVARCYINQPAVASKHFRQPFRIATRQRGLSIKFTISLIPAIIFLICIFLKFILINSKLLTNSHRFDIVPQNPTRRLIMAKKLDPVDLVSFTELLMANSIMADALVQLLITKASLNKPNFSRNWRCFKRNTNRDNEHDHGSTPVVHFNRNN